MVFKKFIGHAAAFFLLLFDSTAFAAQLNYGKYFGTIEMDGQNEAIAVSMDAFVTQIKDPTVYPALEVIIRANLGGYVSSEYVAYDFYDPTFDFERGILHLNDPKNNLTGSLKVINTESETILEGPIFQRLTNTKGLMRLAMKLDDDGRPTEPATTRPLLSVLKGEYIGKCGNDAANLQIETARGLGAETAGSALSGYSISGRMGFSNGPLCKPDRTNRYCSLYPYSIGTYSPFTNQLKLQGPLGTADCTKTGEKLQCFVIGHDKGGACTLEKKSESKTPALQYPTGIFLNVPSEKRQALPQPAPPGNDELIDALNGTFFGFVHFENRDEYQLAELNLVASTSTENPHVQNQVVVNPTLLLRLGNSWSAGPAASLFFEQRVFGLNQGFAFQASGSDYFVVIGDWRVGYLSGVLYSKSFGRVGTFEMQKNERPAVPVEMKVIKSPVGSFESARDSSNSTGVRRSLEISIPNQSSSSAQSAVSLLARFSIPGSTTTFDAAALDLNVGSLSFLIKKAYGDRLVTGAQADDGTLSIQWPVAPALGAPMRGYTPINFKRINGD